MRDRSTVEQIVQLFPPKAATTDNTVYTSAIIDTALFDGLTLAITFGTLATGAATYAVAFNEGNAANMSDGAAVAAANVIGTVPAPTGADSGKTYQWGYGGNKRYVQVVITPSGNTGNCFIAGVAVQASPRTMPTPAKA